MECARVNFGIPGFSKTYSRTDGGFNIRLSTCGRDPRRIDLLGVGKRSSLTIVVNNAKCRDDLLKNSQGRLNGVELLETPFDDSLAGYLRGNFPPAAVFYGLKSGSVDELNRAIEVLGKNQILNTALVVHGKDAQRAHLKEYEPLDFFTKVTDQALARKILNIRQEWIDTISSFDRFMNGAWGSLLLLQERDNYTAMHSEAVALLAYLVAEKLGLTPLELEILKIGGIFHDLGKIGIPDEILNKRGALTDEEYTQMKLHPEKGVGVVSPLTMGFSENFGQRVLEMVKYHHRRYDNGGYPDIEDGLEELSLPAFIASGADSLDAMTTQRVYKERGITLAEKEEDIRWNKGRQFHPFVAEAMLELLEEGISVEAQMPMPSTSILRGKSVTSLN